MLFFMPKERSTAEPKRRRSRRTKERTSPPHQRADVPVDNGAGRLVAARGTRRPWAGALVAARGARRLWGGCACCSLRADVLPTMGRVRLLQPEGRAGHGAGGLVAARGARRLWGGRAYCSGAAAELADTFSDHVLWQAVRGRKSRSAARRTGRLQGESMAKRAWRFFEKA